MPPRRVLNPSPIPQPEANGDHAGVVAAAAAPAVLPRLEPHEVPVLKSFTSADYQTWRTEVTDFLQIYNNYQLHPTTLISHTVAEGIQMIWKPANSWAQDSVGDWKTFLDKLDALAHKTLGVVTTLAELKVTKKNGEIQIIEFLSTVARLDARSVEPLATKRRYLLEALKPKKELSVARGELMDYFAENPEATITEAVRELADVFITSVAVARAMATDSKFNNGKSKERGNRPSVSSSSTSAQEGNQHASLYISHGAGRGGGRFQGRGHNQNFGRGRGRGRGGGGRFPFQGQNQGQPNYGQQQQQHYSGPPQQYRPRGPPIQYQQPQAYQPQQHQPVYQNAALLYHAAVPPQQPPPQQPLPLPLAPALPPVNSRLLHISAREAERWREELN